MICPKCRFDNPEDAKFCGNCGFQIGSHSVETEQEKKKREFRKVIIYIFAGIIFAVTAAIALTLVLEDTGSGTNDAEDIVFSLKNTEEKQNNEDSETSEEAVKDLPKIVSTEEVDYDNTLSLENYGSFYADGYSFGFPLYLYKQVEEYGDNGYRFSSASDKYSWLEYRSIKRDDSESIENITNGRCMKLKYDMIGIEEILHKPENGICVLAGADSDDENQKLYHLLRVNENYIYYMTVGFPDTDDKELSDKMNYYIDCLYRMCSFGRGTYKPRTYDQFLNDDMGTKK